MQQFGSLIKVPIIIYRAEERLLIDELMPDNKVEQHPCVGVGGVTTPLQQTHQPLMSQIHAQHLKIVGLHAMFVPCSLKVVSLIISSNMDSQFGVLLQNLC